MEVEEGAAMAATVDPVIALATVGGESPAEAAPQDLWYCVLGFLSAADLCRV